MRHDGDVELIAHRAGNERHLITPALAVADTVELDVHLFWFGLEVRHAKALWPFAVFWEKWHLIPNATRPPLTTILEAAPDDAHLWFDLKGFSTRLPKRLLRETGVRPRMTASCRSWWALRPLRRVTGIRTLWSIANRQQLWLVERLSFADLGDGIVMKECLATAEMLSRLQPRAPTIIVWGVEDLERALELHQLGVSGIIADDLDLLDQVRRHLESTPGSDGPPA